MIDLFVAVVVVGLIVWLALYALEAIGLPEPFGKIARIIVIVAAVVFLINKLTPFIN